MHGFLDFFQVRQDSHVEAAILIQILKSLICAVSMRLDEGLNIRCCPLQTWEVRHTEPVILIIPNCWFYLVPLAVDQRIMLGLLLKASASYLLNVASQGHLRCSGVLNFVWDPLNLVIEEWPFCYVMDPRLIESSSRSLWSGESFTFVETAPPFLSLIQPLIWGRRPGGECNCLLRSVFLFLVRQLSSRQQERQSYQIESLNYHF